MLAAVFAGLAVLPPAALAGAAGGSTHPTPLAPPSSVAQPRIDGNAQEAQLLWASRGRWEGTEPLRFSYQWRLCVDEGLECLDIPGATDRIYAVRGQDVDHRLRVEVTATNEAGKGSALSEATAPVEAAEEGAPTNAAPPSMTGVFRQAEVVAARPGSWQGELPIAFAFRWRLCDAEGGGDCVFLGERKPRLRLRGFMVGRTLRVLVQAGNEVGWSVALSGPSPAVESRPGAAPRNTALPTISGEAREGATLTASPGRWEGDRRMRFSFQWQRCDSAGEACTAIAAAGGERYTVRGGDVDHRLRVAVTASNRAGSVSAVSPPTAVVTRYLQAPRLLSLRVAGEAVEGSTLAAESSWSGTAPIEVSHRWLRCDADGRRCASVEGATRQAYALDARDVGHRLRVAVTATNAAGRAEAISAPTPIVRARPGQPPRNTALPTISGEAREGKALTGERGRWTGSEPIGFSQRWLRCDRSGDDCHSIPGATALTYEVRGDDVHNTIRLRVTATNAVGSATGLSAPTQIVKPAAEEPRNETAPSISGKPEVGSTLTADPGEWTGSQPLSFSFQWRRCDAAGRTCSDIGGTTGQTHTLTDADRGSRLRVAVTARNAGGSSTVVSGPTEVVQPKPPSLPSGAIRLSSGETSLPVTSISLPQRLVVSGVQFAPRVLRSRAPFVMRVRVTDTRGLAVRGALVLVLGLPFGRIDAVPEQPTAMDGWATFRIVPTRLMPLRKGASLVFFVRVRKPGENVLAGVSIRRLVQVRIAP